MHRVLAHGAAVAVGVGFGLLVGVVAVVVAGLGVLLRLGRFGRLLGGVRGFLVGGTLGVRGVLERVGDGFPGLFYRVAHLFAGGMGRNVDADVLAADDHVHGGAGRGLRGGGRDQGGPCGGRRGGAGRGQGVRPGLLRRGLGVERLGERGVALGRRFVAGRFGALLGGLGGGAARRCGRCGGGRGRCGIGGAGCLVLGVGDVVVARDVDAVAAERDVHALVLDRVILGVDDDSGQVDVHRLRFIAVGTGRLRHLHQRGRRGSRLGAFGLLRLLGSLHCRGRWRCGRCGRRGDGLGLAVARRLHDGFVVGHAERGQLLDQPGDDDQQQRVPAETPPAQRHEPGRVAVERAHRRSAELVPAFLRRRRVVGGGCHFRVPNDLCRCLHSTWLPDRCQGKAIGVAFRGTGCRGGGRAGAPTTLRSARPRLR